MIEMTLADQFVAGLQLILTAVLSGVIGLDRDKLTHRAGLRTHILVGVGSCLFTILSMMAFPGGDPGRVASQILPGIGFLGAGTILKEGLNIRGLTTAASIWAVAAVGMAVGTGTWFLAIIATIIIWITLAILIHVEPSHNADNSPD